MKNIYETLVDSGDFTTLVKAIQAAGMEDLLKTSGPFTCLAPTDEAFNRLPSGALDEIMSDPDRLSKLLKNHTIEDRMTAKDLRKIRSINNLLGQTLYLETTNDIQVNHVRVTEPDIRCTNGVIHGIESVMIPETIMVTA